MGTVLGVALITLLVAEGRRDAAPVNAWCEAHYRAARSTVESLSVDQMLNDPNPGKRGLANPRFCGDFRIALERYRQRQSATKPIQRAP